MIPVANVYHLLCYAWDVPLSRDHARLAAVPFLARPDFFAALLIRGTEQLLKRGPDRDYTTRVEESPRPRGRIDFATTAKAHGFAKPTVVCVADDLTHDTPGNRVLKATLRTLACCRDVTRGHADRCAALAGRFADVSDIALSPAAFAAVPRHRSVLLSVCRLLFENRLPDPRPGEVLFADFVRDDRQMAHLFEAFVRNFYRREQSAFPRVGSERFSWRRVEASPADRDLLPVMRTDVTLTSPTRKVVIDAKFYREALSSHFDTPSVHAANLYQLLAYLTNQEPQPGQSLEGLLLYPTTGRELHLNYVLHGHPVRVATVDLAQEWPGIHKRMLELIAG